MTLMEQIASEMRKLISMEVTVENDVIYVTATDVDMKIQFNKDADYDGCSPEEAAEYFAGYAVSEYEDRLRNQLSDSEYFAEMYGSPY